jgi:ubiquinone biosynthesis protein COQ9
MPGTARRGTSDAFANIRAVTELTRSERTSRLLVARLDALATVASKIHHTEAERLVELASIATMHAVALETLQAERAEAIWREAHERHPELPQVVLELPERLAA